MSVAIKHLTSADILALNTTPFVVVPAPGVGKIIIPMVYSYQKRFNTISYAKAGVIDFFLAGFRLFPDDDDIFRLTTNPIDCSGSSPAAYNSDIGSATVMQNTPLVVQATVADPTLGNGDVDLWLVYQIADLP